METDIKELRTTVVNLEKSAIFHEQQYTDIKEKVGSNSNKITDLSTLVSEKSTAGNDMLMIELCALRENVIDVQSRSTRDNLIFCGIQGDPEDDMNKKLGECLKNELKHDCSIEIDRVHTMGGPRARKPRPMFAKFSNPRLCK